MAILVLHHTRKASRESGASGDFMEESLGSQAITGAADGVLHWKRQRGSHVGTLSVAGRDVEEAALAVTWDRDTRTYRLEGDAEHFTQNAVHKKIIDTLRAMGGEGTPAEVAERLGLRRDSIKKAMYRMRDKGALDGGEKGKYLLSSFLPSCVPAVPGVPAVPAVPAVPGVPAVPAVPGDKEPLCGGVGDKKPSRGHAVPGLVPDMSPGKTVAAQGSILDDKASGDTGTLGTHVVLSPLSPAIVPDSGAQNGDKGGDKNGDTVPGEMSPDVPDTPGGARHVTPVTPTEGGKTTKGDTAPHATHPASPSNGLRPGDMDALDKLRATRGTKWTLPEASALLGLRLTEVHKILYRLTEAGKLQNVPGQGWWLAQVVQAAPQGLDWLRAEIGASA